MALRVLGGRRRLALGEAMELVLIRGLPGSGKTTMGERTPVWVAEYGSTGDKLMALRAGGEVETAPDEY